MDGAWRWEDSDDGDSSFRVTLFTVMITINYALCDSGAKHVQGRKKNQRGKSSHCDADWEEETRAK